MFVHAYVCAWKRKREVGAKNDSCELYALIQPFFLPFSGLSEELQQPLQVEF